jgi:hypothetical protein
LRANAPDQKREKMAALIVAYAPVFCIWMLGGCLRDRWQRLSNFYHARIDENANDGCRMMISLL